MDVFGHQDLPVESSIHFHYQRNEPVHCRDVRGALVEPLEIGLDDDYIVIPNDGLDSPHQGQHLFEIVCRRAIDGPIN
jgi:hypothetical protein